MYRRNLDIFLAGGLGLLGGAAYIAHAPGAVQVVLGIALFFAPGYLWSEAILSQRLPGIERTLTTVGLSLILPILGGFLFYWLRIPLFRSAWVGLLVVLTLLGVVAVAVVRLREPPAAPQPEPGRSEPERKTRLPVVHGLVFGAAAIVALGTVAFSVKSAEAQKYPPYTAFSMTRIVVGTTSTVIDGAPATENVYSTTQADLVVTNYQGVAEEYLVKLLKEGKVSKTWDITLSAGETWHKTIAYTAIKYPLLANLYLYPNITKVYRYVDNGVFAPS